MTAVPNLQCELERQVLSKLPAASIAAARTAAPELESLARANWDAGEMPFGTPFRGKTGNPITLKKTGAMEASESFTPIGTKILVRETAPYAKYHISAGFLPTKGLPQSWEAELARASEDALAKAVR